jgi:rhodanese-related sulfurtransferase
MPTDLSFDGLKKLLANEDVQLIEVLPQKEYAEEHLPRAVNIPLKAMNGDSVAGLDRSRPTIVYCWDDT